MRPTTIPDAALGEAMRRVVVAAPDGDLLGENGIAPVEALVYRLPNTGELVYQLRVVLEDGDLERLTAGKPIWLTVLGRLPPFELNVED